MPTASSLLTDSYAVYLVATVALTIWVAQTLRATGRVFLLDVFRGNEVITDSVTRLLVVGFYLVDLGCICLQLRISGPVATPQDAIVAVATKLGVVLLALGGLHLLNLVIFNTLRTQAINSLLPDSAYGPLPAAAPPAATRPLPPLGG